MWSADGGDQHLPLCTTRLVRVATRRAHASGAACAAHARLHVHRHILAELPGIGWEIIKLGVPFGRGLQRRIVALGLRAVMPGLQVALRLFERRAAALGARFYCANLVKTVGCESELAVDGVQADKY